MIGKTMEKNALCLWGWRKGEFYCSSPLPNVGIGYESFRPGERHKMSKTTTSNKMLRAMSPEDVEKAARGDRDARPLRDADLKRMRRTPQTKIMRRALELTQEEFAARYHIPLGTLRDWEQGRAQPDQPARTYLTLIARDPDRINEMLNG
jgi:putative transcriptional regulator